MFDPIKRREAPTQARTDQTFLVHSDSIELILHCFELKRIAMINRLGHMMQAPLRFYE